MISNPEYEANQSKIWNIFYHFFIDSPSLSLLADQCKELISHSTDLKTWNSGPYSSFLRVANASTLSELRRLWTAYSDMSSFSNARRKQFKEEFLAGMKKAHRKGYSGCGDGTAFRSAGPLAMVVQSASLDSAGHFWRTGVTDTDAKAIKAATNVNPTFAHSNQGVGFVAHYGTSVLSAFHLAPIWAATSSNHHTAPKPTLADAYADARGQFEAWCGAFRRRAVQPEAQSVVIRVAVGDALAFCRALLDTSAGVAVSVRVSAWRAEMFALDEPSYQARTAPLTYDVIDTSNLSDHLGILNLLIASTPLLKRAPTSVLYTEKLLSTGDDPITSFSDSLCADLTTMSLLLDITPASYLSGYTTQSNVHEVMSQVTDQNGRQYHERVVWRIPSQLGDPGVPRSLRFDDAELAKLLFRVYLKMFGSENHSEVFARPNISIGWLMGREQVHYCRCTLALLIHRLTKIIHADWEAVVDKIVNYIINDRTLMIGINYLQDFVTQAYLLCGFEESTLVLERSVLTANKSCGPFRNWNITPPPVVCVVFTVPRAKLDILERDKAPATPNLTVEICVQTLANSISTIDTFFGTVAVQGDDEYAVATLNPDPLGKNGRSPIVVILNVPTWMLTYDPSTTNFNFSVVSTGQTTRLVRELGLRLSLHTVHLMDPGVHVIRRKPSLISSPPSPVLSATIHRNLPAPTDPVVATVDRAGSQIPTLTRRVVVQAGKQREVLTSKDTVVKVLQTGPCSVQLILGSIPSQVVTFPFVIEASSAKVRVARQSGWVEVNICILCISSPRLLITKQVVVPPSLLWRGGRAGETTRRFPIVRRKGLYLPWNIHYLNLDSLPSLSTAQKSSLSWLNLHVTLAFSDRENVARKSDTLDGLGNVKNSLHVIFNTACGFQGKKTNLFALNRRAKGGIDTLIFIADLRLDLPNHTIVADAFVLPLNDSLVQRLSRHLGNCISSTCQVVVNDEECIAWKVLLPSLVERCRTWDHNPNCAYDRPGATVPLSFEHGEVPICDCGQGKVTSSFRQRKEWAPFLPYVTRVAISPLFAVSYLEPVSGLLKEALLKMSGSSTAKTSTGNSGAFIEEINSEDGTQMLFCRACRKSLSGDRPMVCSRCKKAAYCGKECQTKDWKTHKADCKKL